MSAPVLDISGLSLSIGRHEILKEVGLTVNPGEVVGLVGESGSGKSMTAHAVMRLLPHAAQATGRIAFNGDDLIAASETRMCELRGDEIGMVFQEPMTALNPVKTIGEQVAEGIRFHTGAGRADAEKRARDMLARVGLPENRFPAHALPARTVRRPAPARRHRHRLRAAPKLLIADEPTTALDVVLQAQILDLLRELVAEDGMGLILISHDLGVVADMADRITILRHGAVQETGETAQVLREQKHPYTRQLAEASTHVPAWANAKTPPGDEHRLLEVENVSRHFPGHRTGLFSRAEPVRAVDGVSFSVRAGHSVALVGQSGCGKSTLARMILALDRPTGGAIISTAWRPPRSTNTPCAPPAAKCRSSFRTRTAPSIRARRSAIRSPSRCICWTGR
jgi:peptide/nickel transport system ATP-binding protein